MSIVSSPVLATETDMRGFADATTRINIDRRHGVRFEGLKLGELLFWKDPSLLVWMLAMPRKVR